MAHTYYRPIQYRPVAQRRVCRHQNPRITAPRSSVSIKLSSNKPNPTASEFDFLLLRTRISRSRVRRQLRVLLGEARSAEKVRPDLPALLLRLLEGGGRKYLPYPIALPHFDFARRC